MPVPRIAHEERAQVEPLDLLAAQCRRLAEVVSAISRRRDVRTVRSRLLILLLNHRCPLGTTPRHAYYVPGAVVRMGVDGIRRAWRGEFGEEPPSVRSLRTHLAVLERNLAIMRSPGDFIEQTYPDHPERRPRMAQTLHLLETDRAAAWWAREGMRLLRENPKARTNPFLWRRLLGNWRERAKDLQLDLLDAQEALEAMPETIETPGEAPGMVPEAVPSTARPARQESGSPEPSTDVRLVRGLKSVALSRGDAIETITALRRAGVPLQGGRLVMQLASYMDRTRGAAAMLAVALARGDRIRSVAGWYVRAFKSATTDEFRDALRLLHGLPSRPDPPIRTRAPEPPAATPTAPARPARGSITSILDAMRIHDPKADTARRFPWSKNKK